MFNHYVCVCVYAHALALLIHLHVRKYYVGKKKFFKKLILEM